MNELITVIVTCYNRENDIIKCLLSIQQQTYKNFECIIIDDGSTDNSNNLIKTFSQNDKRFKLITSKHIGFPLAKNIGLDNATGEYIIFLDSDDTAYPYWLEILYLGAKLTKAPIITCYYDGYTDKPQKELNLQTVISKGLPISEFSYLKMSLLYYRICSNYMWNKLIKKDLYQGIRHVDQLAMSDVSVMYKIFDRAEKVVQIKLPLIHYHIHQHNMTTTTRQKGLEYWQFRINLMLEKDTFIYNKYPQTRYLIKQCVLLDLQAAKKELGDDFNKLDLSQLNFILQDKSLPIIL